MVIMKYDNADATSGSVKLLLTKIGKGYISLDFAYLFLILVPVLPIYF